RESLRVWGCWMNPSQRIKLRLKLLALTLPCATATPPKLKSYMRWITWPTRICRRLGTLRRRRLSISPQKCGRQIRKGSSSRLTRWPQFQHAMCLSGTIGRPRQTCPFRTSHTGLRSLSWKLSSNMVTRSDAHTSATATARAKRSHECSNYATRRKIQSSIISKVISTCRSKQLQHGWQQRKAKRTKHSICCGGRRIPKTYSASIPFHRERSFRFVNNSALCCWKWGNRRKHNGNLRPRSRSIPDNSEVCRERHKPPSKPAIMRMLAGTTPNWPHRRQKLAVHEMN